MAASTAGHTGLLHTKAGRLTKDETDVCIVIYKLDKGETDMKKLLFLLLGFIMLVGFYACGHGKRPEETTKMNAKTARPTTITVQTKEDDRFLT